jgi:dienelactone hydrolase
MLEQPPDGRNPQLEEALQFLKGPEFIPAQSQPARIEFNPDNSERHFRFPTPRPGEFAENNVVYGRLYRSAERWRERPVIVLLQSGSGFVSHRIRFPLIARHCNRAGFNAATLVAPYYFQRRPRQPGALSDPDYLRDAEIFAQAVAEIRALTGWLLGEGCPAVALWGTSYGGALAGLTVCRDARLAAVVLTVPGVRPKWSSARELVLRRRIRESRRMQRVALEALSLTSLNLTAARPVIPRQNILLIEAIHDLCVPKEDIEELWQAWGRPDIWRLPHGHVSGASAPGLTSRVLRWLAPRLDKPAVRTGRTAVLPH